MPDQRLYDTLSENHLLQIEANIVAKHIDIPLSTSYNIEDGNCLKPIPKWRNEIVWKDITLYEIFEAYNTCKKSKSNKNTHKEFELNLYDNLYSIYETLSTGTYKHSQSVRFAITQPKAREVYASNFRDRVIQHFVYNRISTQFNNTFIIDNCACIPGRGTHYAARRYHRKVKGITNNWTKEAYYLKCDFSNFFTNINKNILFSIICKKIENPHMLNLIYDIINSDYINHSINQVPYELENIIPYNKKAINNKLYMGLPIGNITSQLFANIYLNELDQFIKRELKIKYYIRYVDDFIILSNNKEDLSLYLEKIKNKIIDLELELNNKKTIKHSVYKSSDFIGAVSKLHKLEIRKITTQKMYKALKYEDYELYYNYKGMHKNNNNYNTIKKYQYKLYETF